MRRQYSSTMEVKIQRPAYYFSWPDDEILDEKLLEIGGDDETWLYRVERGDFISHFKTPTQNNYFHTPSGSTDSRTFTRRKHTQRPSLESVAESNRSSIGILSASRLNDTKLMDYSTTPISTNQGRTSSSFIASDKAPVPRVFRLDTPLMNNPFQRNRHDSELSDSSIIPSLDSQFDKNEAMTDSLVNFLKKHNDKCRPPLAFQDVNQMTESDISLPESERAELHEEDMTDSMVNFLEPVSCKPPSGFGDDEMSNSIVNIEEKDVLPTSDMTNSLMDYLEGGNMKTSDLTLKTTMNEDENIPPERLTNREEESRYLNHTERLMDEKSYGKFHSTTLDVRKEKDMVDDFEKSPEISFTNNVNISTNNKKDKTDRKDDRSLSRPLNATFQKENQSVHKLRALNNKDLNVTQDCNDEIKEFNLTKLNKTNSSASLLNTRMNGTFTIDNDISTHLVGTFTKSTNDSSHMNGTLARNNLNRTSNISRQIPQRNSTFNTTFTKLDLHMETSRNMVTRSTECLDTGLEDDRTSSASDSSFSSAASSSKPRSVDELRTIAQQQETNLQLQSSTPTEVNPPPNLAHLNLVELSPIRRVSLENRRVVESRSAHSSPVRSPALQIARPHPISRLHQSSLSNLTQIKPRVSRLQMPQASGRWSTMGRQEPRPSTAPAPTPARQEPRPSTAPAPAPTGIPRPQVSRLPMPRVRASGIPTMKRGPH